MPKLNAVEKRNILNENARLAQGIGQLRANIKEMEREGRTKVENCPPLDKDSLANVGKSQYDISKENLQSYIEKRDALVAKYPGLIETGEEIV